jgi:aminopeptidase N
MVFGTDRDGRALAFADNWPNRARWWFPGNDHPSDKATVRFDVRVPSGWGVVANGRLRSGPTPLEDAGVRWVWGTELPIPTYTMVVGAARFARASLGPAACGRAPVATGRCVDSSVWALPGDSAFGVERFRRAPDMLDFYAGRFGPFPYAKLAHVQSGTRFGGMENASAIFYARRPWAERTMGEGVIAHEIVHQWYGDSATPARWRHLWLSEGFATYFAAVYFGARDGEEAYRRRMERAAREYRASDAVGRPVVDPTRDLYSLLNANSYQKGARVLHGLRGLVGDSAFVRGVRRFWRRHRDATATTADFRRVVEETAGRDLGWFFDQWLRSPGYPRLEAEWWIEDGPGDDGGPTPGARAPSGDGPGGPATLVLEVRQTQPEAWPAFRLPTRVRIATSTGESRRADATVSGRVDTLRVPLRRAEAGAGVEEVELDPGGWILKTLEIRRRARVPAGS